MDQPAHAPRRHRGALHPHGDGRPPRARRRRRHALKGDRPAVEPLPPVVDGAAAALGLLRDPTGFFQSCRRRLGDTFVVDAFGHRLFCVFSPEGVQSLYAQPEHKASFGLATFTLIRPKVPDELFDGRRNTPHGLFGREDTERYLDNLGAAVDLQLDELRSRGGRTGGSFEAFAFARRLGHRLGLASWAGVEAAAPANLDRLIPMFDRLDSSEAFVRPAAQFVTAATKKRREREAMHGIEGVVGEILAARRRQADPADDFLAQIEASFSDLEPPERDVQVARDLILIHMGSQSNLFAALAWTIVHVARNPAWAERIRAGDDDLLVRCAYEATRLAQRSITLRQVLRPVTIEVGGREHTLAPGVMLTTMLSVTNTSAAPGLDRFDPDHYQGRRLAPTVELPAKELVSTFGHGIHTCPAQRFSISAITLSVRRLLAAYELTPRFTRAEPRRRQIGGVARAAAPCRIDYRPLVSSTK